MDNMYGLFKSLIDQDNMAVVICDINHNIVYMNPAAIKNYEKSGGEKLIGQSIKACHNEKSGKLIEDVVNWFKKSKDNNIIYTNHNEKQNKDVYMVALRDDFENLIGYYEKHEMRNAETKNFYDLI